MPLHWCHGFDKIRRYIRLFSLKMLVKCFWSIIYFNSRFLYFIVFSSVWHSFSNNAQRSKFWKRLLKTMIISQNILKNSYNVGCSMLLSKCLGDAMSIPSTQSHSTQWIDYKTNVNKDLFRIVLVGFE